MESNAGFGYINDPVARKTGSRTAAASRVHQIKTVVVIGPGYVGMPEKRDIGFIFSRFLFYIIQRAFYAEAPAVRQKDLFSAEIEKVKIRHLGTVITVSGNEDELLFRISITEKLHFPLAVAQMDKKIRVVLMALHDLLQNVIITMAIRKNDGSHQNSPFPFKHIEKTFFISVIIFRFPVFFKTEATDF